MTTLLHDVWLWLPIPVDFGDTTGTDGFLGGTGAVTVAYTFSLISKLFPWSI